MQNEELYKNFHAFDHKQLNNQFEYACQNGHLDIVKYLLTSSELKEHANIHTEEDSGLKLACSNGHLNIVEYLLTSPELNEHADMNSYNDYVFLRAFKNNHLELVQYLIFDRNIKKTKAIDSHFEKNPNEQVENMFKIRELNDKLNQELHADKKSNSKNMKV